MKVAFTGSHGKLCDYLFIPMPFLVAVLLIFQPGSVQAIARTAAGGAVQMVFSQCGCLCVEGAPKTLCTSVEEAQEGPGLCGRLQCPDYVASESGGRRYVSPHTFADNCREVRVWDRDAGGYSGVKVCDVLELPAGP